MFQRSSKIDENTKLDRAFEENPVTASRQVAHDNSVFSQTCAECANKRPYKMRAVQELFKNDIDRRVLFCKLIMHAIDVNQLSPKFIVFSDEATFALKGHINKQNWRKVSVVSSTRTCSGLMCLISESVRSRFT